MPNPDEMEALSLDAALGSPDPLAVEAEAPMEEQGIDVDMVGMDVFNPELSPKEKLEALKTFIDIYSGE